MNGPISLRTSVDYLSNVFVQLAHQLLLAGEDETPEAGVVGFH
jgi:hypothetical protein